MGSLAARMASSSLLIAMIGASAASSTPRLPFKHFRTNDGLPQSQVLALHQDRYGELWIGTWNGAARYDGAQFRYLTLRSGLPSTVVFDIVEDGDGELYFAAGAAIARLGRDRSRIAEVVEPPLNDSWLRDLHVDRRGTLWAAAQQGGVVSLHRGHLNRVEAPDLVADALQVLAETGTGELLLGTGEGIYAIENGRSRRWKETPGPWNRPISTLYHPGDGSLVVANSDGLWRLEAGSESRARAVIARDGEPILGVRSALVDRFAQLWVATDHGLLRHLAGRMAHLGQREGLFGEIQVHRFLEDREGNVWIGSDDGLSMHRGDLFQVFMSPDGLADESVWSLALDADGELLAGTRDGAFRFDGEAFSPLREPNPLRGTRVRAIVADPEGRLWFGTHKDGLFRQDGGEWRQFLPPEIPSTRIYGAFRDRQGTLWFATRHGVASYRDGGFRAWTTSDGLPSDIVWTVREDAGGRIVAATASGLARLQGSTFRVSSDLEKLSGVPVRSLVCRRDGSLWAGTEGLGLYAQIDGEWTVFHASDPGSSDAADSPSDDFGWGLLEDARGRLWLATNLGIDLYDGARWTRFSRRDGLRQDEISSNAVLATPGGAAWFGFAGDGGAVRFPAELPRPLESPPIVRITSVRTSKREIAAADPPRLELPWSERDVTFSFVAVSFRDERRVLYRTMLEGYDRDFGPPSRGRSVRYTNLAPKTYRFLVLASTSDGKWPERPVAVEVEILPPYYRTWWFYLLAAVATTVVATAFVRQRLRAITEEKKVLEAKVEERTRELVSEKKKLEEAVAKVRTLSGLLPICSSCNKIRDDNDEWRRLETYIEGHSEASFSHSICPSCARQLYPQYYQKGS